MISCKVYTQGTPLVMVNYGLGILPLVHHLQESFLGIHHTWYSNDAAIGRRFNHICTFWVRLSSNGPSRRYFPELTNSISGKGKYNLRWSSEYFSGLNFNFSQETATCTVGWGIRGVTNLGPI